MPRDSTRCQALTIGQVARRWGVSAARVHRLIADGHLAGVFRIPSAGCYGAVLKIPLASVLQAENEDWVLLAAHGERARPKAARRKNGSGPALKHFPKLRASPEPASECPEAVPG